MLEKLNQSEIIPLGIGYYRAAEAARLLKTPVRNINRWLGGYTYKNSLGQLVEMSPLWRPQLPKLGDAIELGFRDLIELRFVLAFQRHNLGLNIIRNCLEAARALVGDDRPFSTRRFQTDGKTIFLDILRDSGTSELVDLKNRQMVFRQVVEQTFRDLDIEDGAVSQWRPLNGKASIVVDPTRAFGQPIAAAFGVPTITLVQAVQAEGSVERVAAHFEIPPLVVRDAVTFERTLKAA